MTSYMTMFSGFYHGFPSIPTGAPGRSCSDTDPYVRKTATMCVAKLYDINPELVEDQVIFRGEMAGNEGRRFPE